MRDCNNCVWHDGHCLSWDCEYLSRDVVREEFESSRGKKVELKKWHKATFGCYVPLGDITGRNYVTEYVCPYCEESQPFTSRYCCHCGHEVSCEKVG